MMGGVVAGVAVAKEMVNIDPQTKPLPVQTADSFADIYARLDEQYALGVGRLGAIARKKVKITPSSAGNTHNGLFVPLPDDVHRAEMEKQFKNAIDANTQAQLKRLEAFNTDVLEQCGAGDLSNVHLGMLQRRFEACSPEIRFGGKPTHVISLRLRGIDARLYVMASAKAHKVYAVDGRITRIDLRTQQAVQPSLQRAGAYPPSVYSPYLVSLSRGNVFGYGQTHGEDWSQPADSNLREWAQTSSRSIGSAPPPPFMWDAARQGWLKLAPPTACAGLWHQHSLTVLANDRVLVAGGMCDVPRMGDDTTPIEAHLRTAVWDARQRTWLESPSLKESRIFHTASVVSEDRVILTGGLNDPILVDGAKTERQAQALDSVEILADGKWSSLAPLQFARAKHTATVLAGGRLLVVGGLDSQRQTIGKVEMWDPAQAQWLPRASMQVARYGHATAMLTDGRVLVTGGINARDELLNTTEIYNPATDRWADGPALPEHLQGHTAFVLPDGRVLLAGGLVSAPVESPWLHSWHPAEPAWRAEGIVAGANATRLTYRPLLALHASGRLLVFESGSVYTYKLPESVPSGNSEAAVFEFSSEWLKDLAAQTAPPTRAGPVHTQPGRLVLFGRDLWDVRNKLAWLTVVILGLGLCGIWWRKRQKLAFVDTFPMRKAPDKSKLVWKSWTIRGLVYGLLLVVLMPQFLEYWRALKAG